MFLKEKFIFDLLFDRCDFYPNVFQGKPQNRSRSCQQLKERRLFIIQLAISFANAERLSLIYVFW